MNKSEALTKLNSFKELSSNWNSYGADPPSEKAMTWARDFIEHLIALEPYFHQIAPSAIGGVGVSFKGKNNSKRVYVEFRNDLAVAALYSDKDNDEAYVELFEPYAVSTSQILKYLTHEA